MTPGIPSILGMIADHAAPAETLAAICGYLSPPQAEPALAFFIFRDEQWHLAAHGGARPADALCRQAGSISAELFAAGDGTAGYPFEAGWARHLHSGAGELLGMLAAFCGGPALPCGPFAAQVDDACRLAVIALEQGNLMTEATFQPAAPVPGGRNSDCDLPLQTVARMIAQLRPPNEVLAGLCTHMGAAPDERRLAFFLVRGDVWTLAAKGDLSPRDEGLLSLIDPAALSDSLLDKDCGVRHECPTDFGWARHLCSETGELLGMLLGFADGAAAPVGNYASRVESACQLASLAIEQFNLIDELRFQARHDSVSGLFNRTFYERALSAILDRPREAGRRVALLYVNLDRFRLVNDILGLAVGTRLLKRVGMRFRECLRANDLLARVGGDEFALILPEAESEEEVRCIANRLQQALSIPFTIDDNELFITASIGVACSFPDSTPESLERAAYLALYHAKRTGKARVTFFQPGMSAAPPERLEIEKRLRSALDRKEMVLFYQPQINLAANRVCGAEALLRWRQEGFGIVSPAAFMPVLEETGLIVNFGRWALAEACRQGKEWIDEAGLAMRLGVNVSGLQFADPRFVDDVRTILHDTGFPPELLELELTESMLVEDDSTGMQSLRALANAGIQLALDDFGTGHSCLSYLHRLPFRRLKIDQSFVRIIARDEDCPPLLDDIIRMADNLGMTAIAEGIETPHQAGLLRSHGCEEGQGYYFAGPMPPDQFLSFCRQYSTAGSEFAPEPAAVAWHPRRS